MHSRQNLKAFSETGSVGKNRILPIIYILRDTLMMSRLSVWAFRFRLSLGF